MPTDTAPNPVDDPSAVRDSALAQAAASGRPIITAEHERALRAELDRLRHQLEVEFAQRLREARLFGSPDANDDYLQIKEEEAVLAAGLAQTSALLETALVVDESERDTGAVTLGTVVELRHRDSGRMQTLRLVGGHERLTAGVASVGSLVGQALIGRRAGESVEVDLPDGKVRRLEVVAVEAAVDHDS